MIGGSGNSSQRRDDAVLYPFLSTLADYGASRSAIRGYYLSNPWMIGEGVNGRIASVDNHGSGLLSVSNKPSEVNILNIPVYFTVAQYPNTMHSPMSRRVISRGIPLSLSRV